MSSDFETTYADLFDTLTPAQRAEARSAMGSALHEGWIPSRESVELRILLTRGDITTEEFLDRSRELRDRTRAARQAG